MPDRLLRRLLRQLLAAFRQQAGVRTAAFRTGPAYAHCPAEDRPTPHRFDAGRRRCLVCKTTTTKDHDHA